MAKKTQSGETKDRQVQIVLPDPAALLQVIYHRGIAGVILLSLAIITFVGMFESNSGVLVEWWSTLLRRAFGWGSYLIILSIAGIGALILAAKMPSRSEMPWHAIAGAEIVFLALSSLLHLAIAHDTPWETAYAGQGGGYVGAVFGVLFGTVIGPVPSALIWGAVFVWGITVISGWTIQEALEYLEDSVLALRTKIARWLMGQEAQKADIVNVRVRSETDAQDSAPPIAKPAKETKPSRAKRRRRYRISLPPLGLLDLPSDVQFNEAEVQLKKRTIEVTLAQFGVPAEVVEINRGPIVTQFGVEPGYHTRRTADGQETERKVRVSKISSLSDDLALALSAAPIRIEAPIPGRSLVGIEVPNTHVSTVSLRKVMNSAKFGKLKSDLMLGLGEGVAGKPVVADLAKMPHLLIAGATGSGKSACLNALATCLLFQNSPLTLRLVMIDPKRVEFTKYNALPHLYGQIESDAERVVSVLHWLVNEMQDRYQRFSKVGARHIEDYNRHWKVGSSEYLPRIVTIIDELADLMLFAPDDVEKSICRLAQMARATGMHLVLSTQRPSVDVVTGLIKANFPARIGFAVSSGTDSRVILDTVGAETLLGKGDMLYMSPDSSQLTRAQGCYVSDGEIGRVVDYWQDWADREEWESEPTPWDSLVLQEEMLQGDDLLQRAIAVVRMEGSASASLLQRRMHIGYPRAARMIDELEDLGVVGPAQTGGRPREILELPSFETEATTGESTGM